MSLERLSLIFFTSPVIPPPGDDVVKPAVVISQTSEPTRSRVINLIEAPPNAHRGAKLDSNRKEEAYERKGKLRNKEKKENKSWKKSKVVTKVTEIRSQSRLEDKRNSAQSRLFQ